MNKELRGRGKRGVVTWQRTFLNQEDKVVQEGLTLTIVEGRSASREGAGDEAAPE